MTLDTMGNATANGMTAAAFVANYTGLNSGAGLIDFDCCEGGTGIGNLGTFTTNPIELIFTITNPSGTLAAGVYPIAIDFMSFNATTDVANAIYRLEAEEDGLSLIHI